MHEPGLDPATTEMAKSSNIFWSNLNNLNMG
jgi:hypothetical protein